MSYSRFPALALVAAGLTALSASVHAAVTDYFWTATGAGDGGTAAGGTGTWDTTSSLWRNDTATGTLVSYPTTGTFNAARFGGTAGTVTLAAGTNLNANQLFFTTNGYTIAGATGATLTLNGTNPTVTVNSGFTATIDAVLAGSSGSVGLVKAGAGTLILTGNNTFTGGKSFSSGTTRVTSIGNNSATSGNLGGSGALVMGGGTLEYAGAGESTNRAIQLFANASRIDNNGFGTLTLGGAFTNNAGISGTSQFITGGSGHVVYTTNLVDNGASLTSLFTLGSGTTTLSGANTFTGGITVGRNNTLILDYATNATVVAAANTVILGTTNGGGNLTIRGNQSGTTAQTLGALTFTIGNNTVVVDNNGGSGTSLALGSLTRNSSGNLLFDLSSGGTVTADLTASGTSGRINLVNGVLVSGQLTTGSLGVVVRTGTNSYDFATGSAAAAGASITALGATTELVSSGASTTNNYKLSGNKTITTTQTAGTIRVDTTAANLTANNNTLTINAGQTLTLGKNSILFDGTGDFNIVGPGAFGGSAAMFIQQWSTGTVTIGSNVIFPNQRIDKFGTGLLVNNSTSTNLTGINIYGGVYRAGSTAALGTGLITVANGGVLELTADFNRSLGNSGAAFQFLNEGGFSASGGTRNVSLGGAGTPTALTWNNTGNFLLSGNKLILSATTSDSTVDFKNAIDFNGLQREVSVGNGSASTDAIMSGVLSSSLVNGGLYKSGAGTLSLTAVNTYTGRTTVAAGNLNLGVANALAVSSPVTLAGGALSSNFTQSLGALNLSASSILDLGTGGVFSFADSSGQSWTGTLSIVGTFTDGTSVRFGSTADGLTSGQLAQITINGFAATIDASGYLSATAVPEPAAFAALAGVCVLGLAALRRRRHRV